MYLPEQEQKLPSMMLKIPVQKIAFIVGGFCFLLLVLFPYGVLAEESKLFKFIVYRVFDSELSHILGHFVLFGFIGTAVLLFFPKLLSYPILYLSVILNIAWLQESLQLVTFKRRPINMGELMDVAIDLAAAVFVFCIFHVVNWLRKPVD